MVIILISYEFILLLYVMDIILILTLTILLPLSSSIDYKACNHILTTDQYTIFPSANSSSTNATHTIYDITIGTSEPYDSTFTRSVALAGFEMMFSDRIDYYMIPAAYTLPAFSNVQLHVNTVVNLTQISFYVIFIKGGSTYAWFGFDSGNPYWEYNMPTLNTAGISLHEYWTITGGASYSPVNDFRVVPLLSGASA